MFLLLVHVQHTLRVFWVCEQACMYFLCVCAMHFLLTAIYLCFQAAFVPLCPYRLMSGLHAHDA